MALTKQFIEMQEAYERKIADLEAKLAEKTRVAEGYSELFDKKQHENYEQFCEMQELKKQLEYISKNKYEERLLAYERKVNQLKQQLAKKDKEFNWLHNKFAKNVNAKAIAVLEEMLDNEVYINSKLDFEDGNYVLSKIIRAKIKSLKGDN